MQYHVEEQGEANEIVPDNRNGRVNDKDNSEHLIPDKKWRTRQRKDKHSTGYRWWCWK